MSKERYLEQEINKDLKILDLERQLEEVQKENTQLKEMREHLKWKDETRKEKERLERQLDEAREVIRKVEDLATSYYCQKSEYEDSVEIPYWDIIFALNIKEKG